MRLCMFLLLVLAGGAAIDLRAQSSSGLNDVVSIVSGAIAPGPFTGVPAPGFGLTERVSSFTHYVNNQHAAATDDGNPYGTASRPRRTVPTVLPAGAAVEVRGGPYGGMNLTWTAHGTRERPVFVVGVDRPLFQGNGFGHKLVSTGGFMIVDGLLFSGMKHEIMGTAIAIRNSVIRHTNTTAVVVAGRGTVLHRNEVHHNGDANARHERDTHGVLVVPGAYATWLLENDIHHNGGDAVQVGNVARTEPWAEYVWIAGNKLHEDRENGVDIKVSRHVIVAHNQIYGYVPRSSSSGEAVVVHNEPTLVWILNNAIGMSNQGIVCTGADGYVVAGNVIGQVRAVGGYDPRNLYATGGIITYNSTRTFHINNTIWASDGGINIGGGAPTEIVNNAITSLTFANEPIRFNSSTARAASRISNNFVGADPGFVDARRGDFRMRGRTHLVDAGTPHAIFDIFNWLYGVGLARDIYGGGRVIGAAVDIGAAEYQGR